MSEIPVSDQVLVVIVILSIFATVALTAWFIISEAIRAHKADSAYRYRDEQRKIEYHRLNQVMRAGHFGMWREVDNRDLYLKKRMVYDKTD